MMNQQQKTDKELLGPKDDERKLLELAAKAAGVIGKYVDNYEGDYYYYSGNTSGILAKDEDDKDYVWNPLTDDGDALRLAVKLNIDVVQNANCSELWVAAVGPYTEAECMYGDDPYAATRRAIVRAAAAEIGKTL